MKTQKYLIVFLSFIIVLLSFFLAFIIFFTPTNTIGSDKMDINKSKNKDVNKNYNINQFEIQNVHKKKNATETYIQYPVFKNKILNENISKCIKNITEDFENEYQYYQKYNEKEKYKLRLSTDASFLKDDILLIRFSINRNYLGYLNMVKSYETHIFDFNTGNELNIRDLFEDYSKVLFEKTNQYFKNTYGISINENSESYKYLNPTLENYKNIFIKEGIFEYCIFDYKKNENVIIKLDLNEIKPYFKTRKSNNVSNEDKLNEKTMQNIKDIDEKIEDKSKIEDKKNDNPYNIDPNKPMIALTFDDGPNTVVTNKILDILHKNNARATFFIVGRRIEKSIDILKKMDKFNNQIGNHTFSHKNLTKLNKNEILKEIESVNEILQKNIGKKANIVRVPYGSVNNIVLENIKYPLIFWNVDTRDWETRNKDLIINEVRKKIKDGNIILMHDLYESTAQACEIIIPELINKGYQLVTIDELMKFRGIELKNGVKYYNANKK